MRAARIARSALWSVRLLPVRVRPWLLARRKLDRYVVFDEAGLRATRHADKLFVFGSGASLNELTEEELAEIERHQTLGFNWFVRQEFVRCDYHLIRGIPDTDLDARVWRPQLEEYFRLLAENPRFAKTIYLVQGGFRATNGNRAIGLRLLPEGSRIYRWRTIDDAGAPSERLDDGLVHGRSTLQECINFGRFANIPSNGLPYPVFVYAGLLAWLYFQQSLTQSSASIVGNAQLVTKVYFPRLVIPLASVASPVVDFGIALTVLLALMAWYGIVPGIELLAAPAFLALALLVAFGIGLWLSALNVRYRDVPYALPFVAQVWLFATPVIYPTSLLPADWRWLLSLNPMTGVIEGFRWSLLGTGKPSVVVVLVSLGSGLALLASGFAYFRTSERQFADVI